VAHGVLTFVIEVAGGLFHNFPFVTAIPMNPAASTIAPSKWFWAIAVLGLAWSLFGVFQFLATAGANVQGLMATGMTRQQAELYAGLPLWMPVAFAAGVFGGVAGCVLLLMRRELSVSVFWASLIAYGVLYVGDITLGIFAAFGTPQVVILTTVLLIAAGLLWFAYRCRKKGLLK
jgi:hypothetical protein